MCGEVEHKFTTYQIWGNLEMPLRLEASGPIGPQERFPRKRGVLSTFFENNVSKGVQECAQRLKPCYSKNPGSGRDVRQKRQVRHYQDRSQPQRGHPLVLL